MPIQVYEAGDFVVDPGDQKRLYPIEDEPEIQEIVYDKKIQQTSYIQSNIVGVFTDWFTSFFEPGYFKTNRIKTQSAFSEFKSFMKGIYKKDKPILVIDPRAVETAEDSIFGQNMLGRYNMVDPDHDNIGAKLVYSMTIMKSDMFELVYRRNRYRFEVDIMIVEQTMDRQINTYNAMLMNIRHNSKFMLARTVPHMIPIRHIQNIARFHGFDWKSEAFMKFMNTISEYPIIKRVTPNGQYMFYFEQDMNIQVEVPGYPSKDGPEMSDAIEWGARIVDNFTMLADLPSEFLFLTPKQHMTKYDRGIDEDPEGIYYTSPVYADMDWPEEINGYKITNRIDIMLQSEDEPSLNLIPLLRDYNMDVYSFVQDFIGNKQKLADLMMVRVYPNGSCQPIASELSDDGTLTLHDPLHNKIYTANIYLNFQLMNLIKEEAAKTHIGTIEKY